MEGNESPDPPEPLNSDDLVVGDLYLLLSACWAVNEHSTGHGTLRTVRDAYLEEGPTIDPRALGHLSAAANDRTGNDAPARAPGGAPAHRAAAGATAYLPSSAPIDTAAAGTGSAHTMAVVPTWSSNVLNHDPAGCVLSTAGTGATHSGVAALRPSPLPAASLGKTRHVAPGSPSALARPQHDDFADSPAPALTMGSRYPAAYGRLPAVAPSQDGGGYMATRPAAPDPPCAPAPQNGVRAVWFAPMSTTDTGMMRSVGADPPVAPPPCQDGCSSSHVAPASTGTRRRIVPGSRLALA
ncbi:hypothetical protein AURDEDRAFT_189144, partial [Auricularia subglabra TFB-10046 SS5]